MYSPESYWGMTSFGLAVLFFILIFAGGVWFALLPLWTATDLEYQRPMYQDEEEGKADLEGKERKANKRKPNKRRDREPSLSRSRSRSPSSKEVNQADNDSEKEEDSVYEPEPYLVVSALLERRRIHNKNYRDYYALLSVSLGYLIAAVANRPFLIVEGSLNIECSQYDCILFMSHVLILFGTTCHVLPFLLPILLPRRYRDPSILEALLSAAQFVSLILLFFGTASIGAVGRTRDHPIRTCHETGMVQSAVSFGWYLALGILSAIAFAGACMLLVRRIYWTEHSEWRSLFGDKDPPASPEGESEFHDQLLNLLDQHYGGHYTFYLGMLFAFSVSETIILLHDVAVYSILNHWMVQTSPLIPAQGVRIWLDVILILWIVYHGFLYAERLLDTKYPSRYEDISTGEELMVWMNHHIHGTPPPKNAHTERGPTHKKNRTLDDLGRLLLECLTFPFSIIPGLC